MKKTLKILSWIQIVLGVLAIIGSLDPADAYGFLGGALFLACGWVALLYIEEVEGK